MIISYEVLQRVRLHTRNGEQVYFPIIFSQYHPDFVPDARVNLWNISDEAGHWRQFGNYNFSSVILLKMMSSGFGIVSVFNGDLMSVGGMNVAIRGWGKEDVDLFERLLKAFKVFRAPDPGLIHMYHESNQCHSSLSREQKRMCEGSRLSTFGSKEALARFLDKSSFNSLF